MSQRSYKYRKYFLRLGGVAAAMLFGVSQVWAQTDQTPSSAAQPSETSVVVPPPTVPQNVQDNTQAQASNNGQPSKEKFLQPAGESTQAVQANQGTAGEQRQTYQAQMPITPTQLQPPQPPQEGTSNQTTRSGGAQLGVYVVPTDGAGVRISNVTPGTAADAAGLRAGDILLAMNGKSVTNPQDVIQAVRQMHAGDGVELRVWRNGAEQTVTAKLGEMQAVPMSAQYSVPEGGYIEGGYSQPYYNYPNGAVVGHYYGYYPRNYYGPGYYRGYGYGGGGYPYGGAYFGTPGFGYYRGWGGQGVRIGSFGFGWR